MGSTEKELDFNSAFEILFNNFKDKPAPTPGQFRTWLEEKKGISVSYNRSRVAVERLKRNRAKGGASAETSSVKTSSVLRHRSIHG